MTDDVETLSEPWETSKKRNHAYSLITQTDWEGVESMRKVETDVHTCKRWEQYNYHGHRMKCKPGQCRRIPSKSVDMNTPMERSIHRQHQIVFLRWLSREIKRASLTQFPPFWQAVVHIGL